MKKIVTIVGARPQIIKAAALSRQIKTHFRDLVTEVLVHTGQHYDENMSQVFFEELDIPAPNYNLQVGSLSHGKQTAQMIEGIETILEKEKPDCLVVYGDTNSTLAGAIAASKIHVPIVHIEAGLRSHNKAMPEEINRILCDHVSSLLFTPTQTGFDNLVNEGFSANSKPPFTANNPGLFLCGDIMYDNSKYYAEIAESSSNVLINNNLKNNGFILSTIHRNNNTDDPVRLQGIFSALLAIAHHEIVVLPLHPRTRKLMQQNLDEELYQQIITCQNIKLIPPASFLDMIVLENNCKLVITDSGGVQKEAYFFKKPAIILRSETEWIEIVAQKTALIADANPEKILSAYEHHMANKDQLTFPQIFGDGNAAPFILDKILETLQ